MAKIYTPQTPKNNNKKMPKAETIEFLLNYSKSISILKSDRYVIEINKN